MSLPAPTNSLGDSPLALPAVWAQREDLIEVLTEMRSVMVSPAIECVEQADSAARRQVRSRNYRFKRNCPGAEASRGQGCDRNAVDQLAAQARVPGTALRKHGEYLKQPSGHVLTHSDGLLTLCWICRVRLKSPCLLPMSLISW